MSTKAQSRKPNQQRPTVTDVLAIRSAVHGDFAVIAEISQSLLDIMHNCPNWGDLTPAMKESLEMQVHKQARILAGDPFHADSWMDIAGYATLVENTL